MSGIKKNYAKLGNKEKSGWCMISTCFGGKGPTKCYLDVCTLFALKISGSLKLQVNL